MLVRQPAYWLGRAKRPVVFGTQNYAELLRAAFACTHDGALAGAYPVISD